MNKTNKILMAAAAIGLLVAAAPPSPLYVGRFSGDGSLVTALNGSQVTSGTVPAARMGSGTANSHTLLHGNSTFSAVDMAADVTPPVNTGQFNAVNGVKVMTNGNSIFTQMGNATADYSGQIGISGPGVGQPTLWFANGAGTGTNTWQHEVYLPAGVGQIGSLNNMTAGESQTLNVYFNGNPTDMSRSNLLARLGTGMFLNNPSVFGDGCFMFFPHYTTNNTGGLTQIGTADGKPVYLKNAFGHQFGVIAAEDPVGRTNQAGHDIMSLSQGYWPVAASVNMTLSGDPGGVYNQHSWLYFSPATKEAGFPGLVGNVYTNGEAGFVWALKADLATYQVYTQTNLYVGGALLVTNNGPKQSIIGPAYAISDANCTVLITTNTFLGPGNDVPYALCLGDVASANVARNGVLKQAGVYPKYAVTAGAPYEVAESDAAGDLFVNIASQHLKPKVHISTTEVSLSSGVSGVIFNITIAAGKSCGGRVIATTRANNASDFQSRVDTFVFTAENKGGTVIAGISTVGTGDTAVAVSAGTLTTAWTASPNGNSVDIKNAATSSLGTLLNLKTTWRVELDSSDASSALSPQ